MRMVRPAELVGVDLRQGLEWKIYSVRGRLGGVTRDEVVDIILLESGIILCTGHHEKMPLPNLHTRS